jgi:acyl-homoserine lactone acylase PvdQ
MTFAPWRHDLGKVHAVIRFGGWKSRCLHACRSNLVICSACCPSLPWSHSVSLLKWQREAQAVTITRDDWGIAHVHGKTDADAVFGMAYAQAEDDFNRVETNYLNAMGRLAEAEGEPAIWQDLRMKLFIDPVQLKTMYAKSPAGCRR